MYNLEIFRLEFKLMDTGGVLLNILDTGGVLLNIVLGQVAHLIEKSFK
jgi:hypothetical protein